MSTKLRISDKLTLPISFVTSTQVVLAQKGKGKTHTATVEAEELLEVGQQIIVVDPTDAWSGLRSSKDGKSAGYPIAVFGGDHGDVELEPGGGALLATAIVAERFSAIICTANLSKSKELTFVADFLETLYRLNRAAVHLFIDEADIFAPQKPFGGEARTCGAADDIVRRGRKKGIGCTLITQRSSVLNKNVLSQADMLMALGCSHPRDLDAIGEWVKVHADPKLAAEMMESLPSLPRGDAWAWNPADDIFKRITIRDRRTFDSGATPKAGEKAREAKVLAPVDIQKLGASIAAQVERAKENDPKELKAELAKARKAIDILARAHMKDADVAEARIAQLRSFSRPVKQLDTTRAEKLADKVMAVAAAAKASVEASVAKVAEAAAKLEAEVEMLRGKITPPPEWLAKWTAPLRAYAPVALTPGHHVYPSKHAARTAPVERWTPGPLCSEDGAVGRRRDGRLPPGEVKILAAAIQYGGVSKDRLRVLCGYKRSARDTYISRLVKRGFVVVQADGMVMPMPEGIAALPNAGPLPTGLELREYWRSRLPPGEQLILDELIAIYPGDRERGGLAAGKYQRSARDTYISRLKKRGLVSIFGSSVRASEELFS